MSKNWLQSLTTFSGRIIVALVLCLCVVSSTSFAENADKIREAIVVLEEKLSKLEQQRTDQETKERDNLKAQKNAEGGALEGLKREANDIAKRLNEIRDDVEKTLVQIDSKRSELRNATRTAAEKIVNDAKAKAANNNKAGARAALKDSKREINDWSEALRGCKIYEHKQSAKLREAGSSLEVAEAKSELNALEVGLKLLEAEKQRLETEKESIAALKKCGGVPKLVPDTWKEVKELLKELSETIDERAQSVDERLKDYGKRKKDIEEFIAK